MTSKNFSLLNQIDDRIQSDSVDWNKNAFETLLTSNLPAKTIFYYAIDVGLRRLENSLYETYWDATADALNDLSQFLFNPPVDGDTDAYLYEAKCQLLMYSAIAIIKMNTIRRRSIHDAKIACATVCLLLLQPSKSYEVPTVTNEYSACIRSMRFRYLQRIFIIVQWLPTLSKEQFNDLQTHHERYIAIILDQLFSAVSLRDKINGFIDNHLVGDDDTASSGFVLIRRFPVFNEKIIDKYNDLMNMGLANTLKQLNNNNTRRLTCCIWTLSCMIESDRVSLEILSYSAMCEHFSLTPIDFEQKPIKIESLNERDIIVFLLLCAQQNVHLHGGDSTLHPYLLFSSSHLCTQQQKNWWQTAIEQTPWNEFIDHLGTIRLDNDRIHQHPPKTIILETAKILFKSAENLYEQYAKRAASSYEQYAIQYLRAAKTNQGSSDSVNKTNTQGNKQDKLFFFYSQKSMNNDKNYIEQLIEQCEKLARQCDELKMLPEPEEPPRTSSPTKEQQKDIDLSTVLSPFVVEKQERKHSEAVDSTFFATPPSNKIRDVDVQTYEHSPSPPPLPPIVKIPPIEELIEAPLPSFPPFVDLIFSHMDDVNQWINKFCANNEQIQNDINTIRDRLEKINRATSQMMYSNMIMFPPGTNPNPDGFHPNE